MLFKRTLIKKTFTKLKKFKLKGFSNKKKKTIGKFSIIACQTAVISERQLESFYNTFIKKLRQKSSKTSTKIWFRSFPKKITTAKPKEVRMGGGRGKLNEKVLLIRAGDVLFEFENINIEKQLKNPFDLLKGAFSKLCFKIKII